MGKFVLLYIMGTLLGIQIINVGINKILVQQFGTSNEYYVETQCRNIGNSMVSMLTSAISDSINFRVTSPETKSLFDGQATYTVRDTTVTSGFLTSDDYIKINVTARYMDQTKSMVVLVGLPVPSVFNYSLISGGNMTLSGKIKIGPSGSDSLGNANVMTNSSFSISGNAKVHGFVHYVNSITGASSSNIIPNYNPNNLPAYSKAPPVPIPAFDPNNYLSIATQVYPGDLNVTTPMVLGTKTNPAIIYVGGSLNVSAGAVFSGYGIFLVEGSTNISGQATFMISDPSVSNFAFYSVGDVNVSGGSTVYGQIFTEGNVSFSGGSSIVGSCAAGGTMNISGGNSTYIPPDKSLVTPIWNKRPLRPDSYYE